MRVKKILTCIALTVCTLFVLSGCSGKSGGESQITFSSAAIGTVNIEMREGSKYSLKSGKDSFEIVGGSETIKGSLMGMDEAESLQADSFESADYNVISVNGHDGFACTKDNKSVHVIPVSDDVYVALSVTNDAQVIYEAEESIVISNVESNVDVTDNKVDESVDVLSDDINETAVSSDAIDEDATEVEPSIEKVD